MVYDLVERDKHGRDSNKGVGSSRIWHRSPFALRTDLESHPKKERQTDNAGYAASPSARVAGKQSMGRKGDNGIASLLPSTKR